MSAIDYVTATHSTQRKQLLAVGHLVDNAGIVHGHVNSSFDLGRTIFQTLTPGSIKSFYQRTKLDVDYEWDPDAKARIDEAYARIARPPADDAGIYKFMITECDFSMEHADGSFLDHLHFCRDFTALHFPAGSPRVALLHSICGVGTNANPMKIEKLPTLRTLLSDDEMAQIESFPSILRLLVHGPLLAELTACETARLNGLTGVHFHRVLDNAPLYLSADGLWDNLNYHLIHALDFLPPASLQHLATGSYFFEIFTSLHALLSRTGRLAASVEWQPSWALPLADGIEPDTWRHWIVNRVPKAIVLRLAAKTIASLSAQLGHSLEYTLEWEAVKRPTEVSVSEH